MYKTILTFRYIKKNSCNAVTFVNSTLEPVVLEVRSKKVMSQEAILEKVRSIVAEQLSVEAGEVKPDSNFQNDLGADSLDTVELVMALEEAFDIEIPDEAAEGIATVGDAVKYIEEKQS